MGAGASHDLGACDPPHRPQRGTDTGPGRGKRQMSTDGRYGRTPDRYIDPATGSVNNKARYRPDSCETICSHLLQPRLPYRWCSHLASVLRSCAHRFRPWRTLLKIWPCMATASSRFGHFQWSYDRNDQSIRLPALGFLLMFYTNHSPKRHRSVQGHGTDGQTNGQITFDELGTFNGFVSAHHSEVPPFRHNRSYHVTYTKL